jgi:hypothetical protein
MFVASNNTAEKSSGSFCRPLNRAWVFRSCSYPGLNARGYQYAAIFDSSLKAKTSGKRLMLANCVATVVLTFFSLP